MSRIIRLSNSAFTYSKDGHITVTVGKVQYIEDIYFFEVNTKYIPDKKRNAYTDIFLLSLPFLVQVVL